MLEFCYYGDLGGVLKRERRFTEEVARKYLCQIIMAIEHLHSKNILYRDLKPDNILLGHNGNVKLTDFGLSKKDTDNYYSSKSFCGTLAYLAPEMFLETGYGKVIDWYCVGAVFYEFLVGSPPYYDSDFNQMKYNIQHGGLKQRKDLTDNAKDLIIKLLTRQPPLRLGANGAQEVKDHPFFNGIDWNIFTYKTSSGEFDNERANYIMPPCRQTKFTRKMKEEA